MQASVLLYKDKRKEFGKEGDTNTLQSSRQRLKLADPVVVGLGGATVGLGVGLFVGLVTGLVVRAGPGRVGSIGKLEGRSASPGNTKPSWLEKFSSSC